MDAASKGTFQEEWEEVLASVKEAMPAIGCDPELAAAAGFLLRHLAKTGSCGALAR